MKTLRNYEVAGELLLAGTGVPAAVGDQVKMYLNTDANSNFPEFINGVIQNPIVKVNCDSYTSYIIEYDEADLEGAASLIRPSDIIDIVLTVQADIIAAALDAEIARALAAEALLAPKASPAFTGDPTAPTPTYGTSSTQIATTAFVGALFTSGFASTPQALSGAGAVDTTTLVTAYTSTGGTQALTLADGTNGQIKIIAHTVDGGSGVLTPTTKTGYTTITFTNAGETAVLQFYTTVGWLIISLRGAVAA